MFLQKFIVLLLNFIMLLLIASVQRVVSSVDHVTPCVHRVCLLSLRILPLLFIVSFSSCVVGTNPTFALSYRVEFCWKHKGNGCKALTKRFAF